MSWTHISLDQRIRLHPMLTSSLELSCSLPPEGPTVHCVGARLCRTYYPHFSLFLFPLCTEAMSASYPRELGRLVFKYGGFPVASFLPSSSNPVLKPTTTNALFMDATHDNDPGHIPVSAPTSFSFFVSNYAFSCSLVLSMMLSPTLPWPL